MTPIFKGSCTAIITPFTKANKINYKALEKQINHQLKGKTKALVVLGTTGEASTMTLTEKLNVVKFAIEKVNGKIPIIVGVGSNSTSAVIKNIKEFQQLKIDAFLVVTPYYNKCTQNGLIKHFTEIANSSELPIILYNVPGRTAVNILPQTAKTLSTHPKIIGIKEASGNITQIAEIIRLCGNNFAVYCGDDALTLPALSLGAMGVVSVASNVVPEAVSEICESFFSGDLLYSRAIQFLILPLINSLFIEVNPIPVKSALKLIGLDEGYLRLPLTEIEPKNLEVLKTNMQNLNLVK